MYLRSVVTTVPSAAPDTAPPKLISLDDTSLLTRRREAKRQLKQPTRTLCFEEESLGFQESAAQIKARITSHLLTGRTQNKVLQAFTKEVEKKLDQVDGCEFGEVLGKSFRKASLKVSKVIQQIPKSICKISTTELPRVGGKKMSVEGLTEEALATRSRLLRMQKRRQDREKLLDQGSLQDENMISIGNQFEVVVPSRESAFMASQVHYLKKVKQHPERDVTGERIVDQGRDEEEVAKKSFSSLVTDCDFKQCSPVKSLAGRKRKFTDSGCYQSPLKGLDLATPRRMSTRKSVTTAKKPNHDKPSKRPRNLQINDVVEVYFYAKENEWSSSSEGEQSQDSEDEWVQPNQMTPIRQKSERQKRQPVQDDVEEEPDFEELVKKFVHESLEKQRLEQATVETYSSTCSSASKCRSGQLSRRKGISASSMSGPENDQFSHQFSEVTIETQVRSA